MPFMLFNEIDFKNCKKSQHKTRRRDKIKIQHWFISINHSIKLLPLWKSWDSNMKIISKRINFPSLNPNLSDRDWIEMKLFNRKSIPFSPDTVWSRQTCHNYTSTNINFNHAFIDWQHCFGRETRKL